MVISTKVKPKPRITSQSKATHVLFILDSSGSMSSIRNEAIEMFNQQVDVTRSRAADGGRVTVSLSTFGRGSRPIIEYMGEPLERLEKLTAANYQPDGMTPMYDAVGMTITQAEQELADSDEDYAVLVVIVSDGQENYSGKWQFDYKSDEIAWSDSRLAEKIKYLQSTGRWTFTYLGANQDLAEISRTMAIPQGNVQIWHNTSEGAKVASLNLASATTQYFASRAVGQTAMGNFYAPDSNSDEPPAVNPN